MISLSVWVYVFSKGDNVFKESPSPNWQKMVGIFIGYVLGVVVACLLVNWLSAYETAKLEKEYGASTVKYPRLTSQDFKTVGYTRTDDPKEWKNGSTILITNDRGDEIARVVTPTASCELITGYGDQLTPQVAVQIVASAQSDSGFDELSATKETPFFFDNGAAACKRTN